MFSKQCKNRAVSIAASQYNDNGRSKTVSEITHRQTALT